MTTPQEAANRQLLRNDISDLKRCRARHENEHAAAALDRAIECLEQALLHPEEAKPAAFIEEQIVDDFDTAKGIIDHVIGGSDRSDRFDRLKAAIEVFRQHVAFGKDVREALRRADIDADDLENDERIPRGVKCAIAAALRRAEGDV